MPAIPLYLLAECMDKIVICLSAENINLCDHWSILLQEITSMAWAQDCNSRTLAMGLLQYCTKPSIWATIEFEAALDNYLRINHNM